MSLRKLQNLVLTSPRILHLLLQMVSVPSKLLGSGLPEGRVVLHIMAFTERSHQKGVPLLSKMDRVRGWTSGRSFSIYMYPFYIPK